MDFLTTDVMHLFPSGTFSIDVSNKMEQLVELRIWNALVGHPEALGVPDVSLVAFRTAGELL